jgi:hypothetical protein
MVGSMDRMCQRPAARRTCASRVLRTTSVAFGITLALSMPKQSLADEGGNSIYLPGSFASLSAVPGQPGWSLATTYYHLTGHGPGPASETSDLGYGALTYTFKDSVLGGQLALTLVEATGRNAVSLPGIADGRWGLNDLVPFATMRWNSGVNNYMIYGTGEIPSGTYDPLRLANFGLGHGGADTGAGYTYFNEKTGNEFSAVAGLTYNLVNPYTHYQNGIDSHIDWAASKFLTKEIQVGLVGYYYQQLTADHGPGAIFGGFESRVAAVGPQIGYLFPVGNLQGYLNLKCYGEFAAQNRPEGWNLWLTFAVSPKAPDAPSLGSRPPYR